MRIIILVFVFSTFFVSFCLWNVDINQENSRKAELRQALNNAIEDSFDDFMVKNIHGTKDINILMEEFNKNLLLGISSSGKIIVKLLGSDMENGILYIRVESIYDKALYGEGKVVCEKALILEEY